MKIGIVGPGNMTTAFGRRFVSKGHELVIRYSRDRAKLERAALDVGGGTRTGSPEETATFSDSSSLG